MLQDSLLCNSWLQQKHVQPVCSAHDATSQNGPATAQIDEMHMGYGVCQGSQAPATSQAEQIQLWQGTVTLLYMHRACVYSTKQQQQQEEQQQQQEEQQQQTLPRHLQSPP